MTHPTEPLIEAAVRPFADNAEMQLAATRLLSDCLKDGRDRSPQRSGECEANESAHEKLENPSMVGHSPPILADRPEGDPCQRPFVRQPPSNLTESNESNAAEAIERWNAIDARKHKLVWRIVLFTVMAVVSSIMLVDVGRDILPFIRMYSSLTSFVPSSPAYRYQQQLEERLSTSQKLLLFGDSSQPTKAGRMKALWDSEPDNPAYFGEYAKAYLSDNAALPPDFLDTARRIDPQNSWFTYLAAAVECKGSVEKRKQSKASKDAGEARAWDIRDKAKLDRAHVLLHEARSQPECRNYTKELTRRRIEILPRNNPTDNLHSIAYLAGTGASDIIYLRHLSDAISAKGWTLGEEVDASSLQELIGDSDAFVTALAGIEISNMIEVLVFKVCAAGTSKELGAAAAKLGLAADASRLTETYQRFEAHKLARDTRKPSPDRVGPQANGALLASLTLPMIARQMESPPPLTDDDVKPGRLADHELFARVSCVGAWIILMVLFCGTAGYRYRSPALIRRLAKRMEALMRPADWAWLLGAGLLLPLVYVMILNRFTPLGGRHLGLQTIFMLLPTAHFLGLTVLMILLPILITRWRLAKRAAAFGFANGRSWTAWIAVVCAVGFIPVVGWGACAGSETGLVVAAALILVPALWLLAVMLRALFSKPTKLLHRSTSARVLLPVHATAMLLLVALVPIYKTAAQRWFEQDTLIRLDPAHPSMTRYEYQAAVQMRKEFREVLGLER